MDDIDDYLLAKNQHTAGQTIARLSQRYACCSHWPVCGDVQWRASLRDPPSWMGEDANDIREAYPVVPSIEEQLRSGAKGLCLLCKTFECGRHGRAYYNASGPEYCFG